MNEPIESRNAQWDAFLKRWPLEELSSMSLQEYSEAGNQDCFVYWLEAKTEALGSVWGGSAFKFGIYSRKKPGEEKRDGDRYYGEKYAWYAKYGDTPAAAFAQVVGKAVQVAKAARAGNLEAIDEVDLGQVVKWKIAFLYQDRQQPTILPVLKLEYLQAAVESKQKKVSALQRELMKHDDGRGVFEFGDAVWANVQDKLGTELTTDEAKVFLDQSDRFTQVKPATQKMAGYSTSGGWQIALPLDNKKTTIYLGAGSWLASVRSQLREVESYSATRTRSSNIAENAPALAVGNAMVKVVVPNMETLLALCDAYDSADEAEEIDRSTDTTKIMNHAPPLNQILFGPPGTGKTYETINAALAILAPDFLAANRDDRAAIKAHFDSLVAAGYVRFVTFHQSFSYEDFVEGIRAESTDDGQLDYSVVDGVFKSLCGVADASIGTQPASATLAPGSVPFQVGEVFGQGYKVTKASADVLELMKPNGNELGFSMRMLAKLADYLRRGEITIEDIKKKLVFDKLPKSSLEPYLVNGYNNILPALVERLVGASPLTPMVDVSLPTRDAKVLIIDEINRGNVSRVLGELITLIEPSKRAGNAEALEVTLPYSKERFSVPANLYLIGTMNTADRSLAGLDLALRRRFSFREMPPRPELLDAVEISGVNVGALLRVMNERIELLLDRDHCIGHAYFMPLVDAPTIVELGHVFRSKLIPLLQEYFFEDWQRIQWVLNDHRKAAAYRFIQRPSSNVAQLFGEGVSVTDQNQRWTINEAAFSLAEAYGGVIEHLGVIGE